MLVVFSVMFFDRIKADDPVGATSVHLVNGVFGTLCVGLFAETRFLEAMALSNKPGLFFGGGTEQLIAQVKGIVGTAIYVVVASVICWGIIKATIGMRVSPEEELEGLDKRRARQRSLPRLCHGRGEHVIRVPKQRTDALHNQLGAAGLHGRESSPRNATNSSGESPFARISGSTTDTKTETILESGI